MLNLIRRLLNRNDGYLIWWLDQQACEEVETRWGGKPPAPRYIQQQFLSRYGRPARGRLWVADGIPIKEIEWNRHAPASRWAEDCGGIVIHARDRRYVENMPGFITDLDLHYA